ncbi:hypothetical protein GPJ56_007321 [Histomonas meleagridis]|uniref:uncharacterized protein n=1 Tax=Histomonas meleagridis TaxID=135588 RepID=UPI00355AA754|nr:hypothetical protein GPJ56_007321 [Histomonas meleagridis]KAH0804167.1 hypothetical protein GO595_002997 [Histomonas meleagridis]
MASFGFTSISFDDPLARMTYVEELPMIAECLTFDHFCQELQTILRSIGQISSMVTKLIEALPDILSHLKKENKFKVIYLIGEKLCISAEENVKQQFLTLAEKLLQELGDIQYEFTELIKPQLETLSEFPNKFALWRLARLTRICDDYSQFEEIICRAFSIPDLSNISEILSILHPDLARKYIINAFLCPSDSSHISAINALETHKIDANEECFAIHLLNEQSPSVLSRICKLPPEMISKDLLIRLLETDSISSLAASVALASPYFEEVLPKLEGTGAVGCELNCVNFDNLKKFSSIPYDFLSLMLKESKEILKQSTIENIASLDISNILTKLIFPRMNEKGNWRTRFNAIQIAKELLKKEEVINNKQYMFEFAKFVIAMGCDHVYSVRKAAFELLGMFPKGEEMDFVIDAFCTMADGELDENEKQILEEFVTLTRKVLVENCEKEKVEKLCKAVKIDGNAANIFDMSQ